MLRFSVAASPAQKFLKGFNSATRHRHLSQFLNFMRRLSCASCNQACLKVENHHSYSQPAFCGRCEWGCRGLLAARSHPCGWGACSSWGLCRCQSPAYRPTRTTGPAWTSTARCPWCVGLGCVQSPKGRNSPQLLPHLTLQKRDYCLNFVIMFSVTFRS